MTCEEKKEIYDFVSNYWSLVEMVPGNINKNKSNVDLCFDLIADEYGEEAIFYGERCMLDLGFGIS